MIIYTATFSNGQTVTRKSQRTYRFAVGLVNKQTGQLRNVKFTDSDTPKPDWRGVATMPRGGVMSNRDFIMCSLDVAIEREK